MEELKPEEPVKEKKLYVHRTVGDKLERKLILESELDKYLTQGWIKGRN